MLMVTRKLGYREQRELARLPDTIEALELRFAELEGQISAAGFYARGHEVTGPVLAELAATQTRLDQALERWAELEQLRGQ